MSDRITAKAYNIFKLELLSIKKHSLLCNKTKEIKREYMKLLEIKNKDNLNVYLKELTQIYNNKIKK